MRTPGAGRERVALRDVHASDIGLFFEQQRDPRTHWTAAFSTGRPEDRAGFALHWQRVLGDAAIVKRTVLVDGDVAGHVLAFEQLGLREVSYWIGDAFCGRQVATRALSLFLDACSGPMHARVAKDNTASLRVLQKNGFAVCGEGRGFAEVRGAEVEEWILIKPELSASRPDTPAARPRPLKSHSIHIDSA